MRVRLLRGAPFHAKRSGDQVSLIRKPDGFETRAWHHALLVERHTRKHEGLVSLGDTSSNLVESTLDEG